MTRWQDGKVGKDDKMPMRKLGTLASLGRCEAHWPCLVSGERCEQECQPGIGALHPF